MEIIINDSGENNNESIDLSVIVPAYNEGNWIYNNLLSINNIVTEFCNSFEILCVNDGSKDNTCEQILKAARECNNIRCITYEQNGGKGKAIREGVLEARGRYIAFLDADLDISPLHLKSFFEVIKQGDINVVIGSKMHPESVLDYPMSRKIISFGYYILLRLLFHLNVHDTQTGVKMFEGDLLKKIIGNVCTNGFAYDIEILVLARLYGAHIVEMPITLEFKRQKGFSRIKLNDIIKVFFDTLRIKRRYYLLKKRS